MSSFSKVLLVWLTAALLTVCLALLSVVDNASAQEDVKAIHNLELESSGPGELVATWDEPTETPVDYRVSWARVGESFVTWTDPSGNAFPITNTLTITGLDEGERYKVKVRARYQGIGDGRPGAWSEQVEADIVVSPTATPTATPTSTATSTAPHRLRHRLPHRHLRPHRLPHRLRLQRRRRHLRRLYGDSDCYANGDAHSDCDADAW